MAMNYFGNLFSVESNDSSHIYPIAAAFAKLPEEMLRNIQALITNEEIRHAIFSMGGVRSPEPDGLHALFYQSQWDIVGDSVCKFVKSYFSNLIMIASINDVDLALIPKNDNPKEIKHFGSISLCNVIYKVIMKVIANRLKSHLETLIDPFQCNIISGKHSANDIITLQEILHLMKRKKGKKGWVAIKVLVIEKSVTKFIDRLTSIIYFCLSQ